MYAILIKQIANFSKNLILVNYKLNLQIFFLFFVLNYSIRYRNIQNSNFLKNLIFNDLVI